VEDIDCTDLDKVHTNFAMVIGIFKEREHIFQENSLNCREWVRVTISIYL